MTVIILLLATVLVVVWKKKPKEVIKEVVKTQTIDRVINRTVYVDTNGRVITHETVTEHEVAHEVAKEVTKWKSYSYLANAAWGVDSLVPRAGTIKFKVLFDNWYIGPEYYYEKPILIGVTVLF